MKRLLPLLLLLALAIPALAQASPSVVVDRFYRDWVAWHQAGGPRDEWVRQHRGLLAPSLYEPLHRILAWQPEGVAHPLDYDPFVGGQESFTSYHVGTPQVRGDAAVVPVALRVGARGGFPGNVLHRKVRLQRIDGRWLIADFVYGNDTLTGVLAEVAAELRAEASPIPSGALQAVVVVVPDWNARQGTLRMFQRSGRQAGWLAVGEALPVMVGRSGLGWGRGLHPTQAGLGPVKREGDGRAPAGVFRLSALFGSRNPHPEAGGLPFLETTPTLECVDDPSSRYYNRIVDRQQVPDVDWKSSERMQIAPYRVGVVVDHNTDQPVPGAGSCIFLHLWQGETVPTSGCTASSEVLMSSLAGWLRNEAAPVLVQLPAAEYERLRLEWKLP